MIWQSGSESILAASFKADGGISSKPADFLLFKFLIYLYTLSSVINPNLNQYKIQNKYKIHLPRGLKLLRLGLSHLHEYKFGHKFNDTIDPFCCVELTV